MDKSKQLHHYIYAGLGFNSVGVMALLSNVVMGEICLDCSWVATRIVDENHQNLSQLASSIRRGLKISSTKEMLFVRGQIITWRSLRVIHQNFMLLY